METIEVLNSLSNFGTIGIIIAAIVLAKKYGIIKALANGNGNGNEEIKKMKDKLDLIEGNHFNELNKKFDEAILQHKEQIYLLKDIRDKIK